MSGSRARVSLVLWFAALVAGCGGDPDSRVGSRTTGSAAARLAEVAYWFRYEGALFGHEALEQRFARPGLFAALVAEPAELSRFLAASQYVVACVDGATAAIVFHGPWYRNLLVTRWSVGPTIDLSGVAVVHGSASDPMPGPAWTAPAPDTDVAETFERLAALQRSAALAPALCAETPPAADEAGLLLVEATERGDAHEPLHDAAGFPGIVHRAIVRYFDGGDFAPLVALLRPEHPLLEARGDASARTQLAPLFAAFAPPSEPAAMLVAYADLRIPGRYVVAHAAPPGAAYEPQAAGLELALLHLDPR